MRLYPRVVSRSRALARVVGLLLCVALITPASSIADWPTYGRDLANSRNAVGDGPALAEAAALNRTWSFTDPDGDFTGTPVVAAGLVVAGSFAGHVHALDAVTGVERWRAELDGPINGSAAIDPRASGGGAVYVPVATKGSPHLVALSLRTGEKRWSTVLTDQPTSSVYGSPVYWNGTLYIGTSGPNGDDSTARGTIVALNAATGGIRWRTYTVPPGHDGGPVWSTPAIDTQTGHLFAGTGNAYHGEAADTTDAILALDAKTGAILDHFSATPDDVFGPDNPLGPDLDFGASPNLLEDAAGNRLVGEADKGGTYWALDRATLDPAWSASVGPGSPVGGVIGSTAYDGARIYGTNALNGAVWALGRNGNAVWQSTDSGPLDFAPVAVGNGVLYTVDPTGFLVLRTATTGVVLRRLPLGQPSFGGVSVVGQAVYAAVGVGPLPEPAPQQAGAGKIIAFGDTSGSRTAGPGRNRN
jgi:polyvinyl alcohol dehydrogenase (cytochrome)